VAGFSLLSLVTTTYNSFYFVTLDDWDARNKKGLTADVIIRQLNQKLAGVAEAQVFAFSPPAIPGIGTSGGVTFMLEIVRARSRVSGREYRHVPRGWPEATRVCPALHHAAASAPQFFAEVDRDKVLKQGITLSSVYQALQAFLGGAFVNYFNQYGRVWQVYVQAEGEFMNEGRERRSVLRAQRRRPPGAAVHLGHDEQVNGPEFTMRFNEYRAAQINGFWRPATAPGRGCGRSRSLRGNHVPRHGLRLLGNVVPGKGGGGRHPASCRLRLLAARGIPAPGRPVRELDPAIRRLLGTPSPSWAPWARSGSPGSSSTCSPRSAW